MRRALLTLLLMYCGLAKAGDVLFIDLDGSLDEARNCRKGVDEANGRKGKCIDPNLPDGPGRPDCFEQISEGVDKEKVRERIDALADSGRTFDTILISGHDGSGKFYGKPGNEISAADLNEILGDNPKLQSGVQMVGLLGCYSITAGQCETSWLRNVGPNVKVAAGFTLKAPFSSDPKDHQLVHEVCKTRGQAINSQNDSELCSYFESVKQKFPYVLGICSQREGNTKVASGAYGPGAGSCLNTYAEIRRKCGNFIRSTGSTGGGLDIYRKYLEAREPGFADVPPESKPGQRASPIEDWYEQLHAWNHCREPFKAAMASELPDPLQVQRLVAFRDYKRRVGLAHGADIRQYNEKLRQIGHPELALTDLENMSRQEIVSRTQGAVSLLATLRGPINRVDPGQLSMMAQGFDKVLRNIQVGCTDSSWTDDEMHPSRCIAPYGRKPEL